ncbi:MAG: glycerol-3-phosphate acyltransferase, partial [Planctomycetota bacterium]
GATNLGRALGFKYFLLCFLLDALKGFAPTLAFGLVTGWLGTESLTLAPTQTLLWLTIAVVPVLGHSFSPFIGFKGGKGVATAFGSLLGVFPTLTLPALGAMVVFLGVFWISRYVSLASICASAALPVWVWYFFAMSGNALATRDELGRLNELETKPAAAVIFTAALGAFVIWKHRSNIRRLLDGTENKIGTPKPNAGAKPAQPPRHAPDADTHATDAARRPDSFS